MDWLAIEADYRPNKLSLRTIGEKYGCTEGAIRKRAKKEGWVRDLSEKIKNKADFILRRNMGHLLLDIRILMPRSSIVTLNGCGAVHFQKTNPKK